MPPCDVTRGRSPCSRQKLLATDMDGRSGLQPVEQHLQIALPLCQLRVSGSGIGPCTVGSQEKD